MRYLISCFIITNFAFSLLTPIDVYAQDKGGFEGAIDTLSNFEEDVTGKAPDNEDRLGLTVAAIIQGAIGIIGILLLILLIYAGFLYMTARGNDEQVTRAQSYIKNAIIGLIIILMAYALTVFFIQQLTSAVLDTNRFLN